MLYQTITDLIGLVPAGFEGVAWAVCAVVLLYLVSCAFGVIGSVVRWITRGD